MLCAGLAWPAHAITANTSVIPSAVTVTKETAYTGIFEGGAEAHTGLFGADNPVNRIDPSGHDDLVLTLSAIAIGVTIDTLLVSQVSVNYVKYFGLSSQDRAAAIAQNNEAVAKLQAIIDSDGDITFQQENLVVGGKLGMVLPGGGTFQKAANLFESFPWNLEGLPSGGKELLARLSTGIWTPLPVPDSFANTPGNRVVLARALLNRNQAFADWLQRNY